jgi:hypothetical protein
MNDNHTSNDTLRSNEFDVFILRGALSCARGISLDVSQVADVTDGTVWCTMCCVVWIEVGS